MGEFSYFGKWGLVPLSSYRRELGMGIYAGTDESNDNGCILQKSLAAKGRVGATNVADLKLGSSKG